MKPSRNPRAKIVRFNIARVKMVAQKEFVLTARQAQWRVAADHGAARRIARPEAAASRVAFQQGGRAPLPQ